MSTNRPRVKKKPQCAGCKKKLTNVFAVCRCKRMYCYSCVNPESHKCPNLQEFIEAGVLDQEKSQKCGEGAAGDI